MVSFESTRYAIARRYMIRLRRDDLADSGTVARLAATAGVPVAEFRRQFEHVTDDEPPPLELTVPSPQEAAPR
jgi:6-phosphofructokinase 1